MIKIRFYCFIDKLFIIVSDSIAFSQLIPSKSFSIVVLIVESSIQCGIIALLFIFY
jgi:hypothetical protein